MRPGSQTILVLTQRLDVTADWVVSECVGRGHRVVRFDTGDFPAKASISAALRSRSWSSVLTHEGGMLRLEEVRSIWFRRPTAFRPDPTLSLDEQRFARTEATYGIGGILRGLNCRWINDPDRLIRAEHKPLQLVSARGVGLRTPRTLLTNAPERVRSFARECENGIVYKTLTGPFLAQSGKTVAIYTSEIDLQSLYSGALDESINHTVNLFQEKLIRRAEVRVVVVGSSVFAARHTPRVGRTSDEIDWRTIQDDLDCMAMELPDDIAQMCISLVHQLGLAFAAMDFAELPGGELVFLELNPNGQWGWIELATQLPITKALVDALSF